MNVKLVKLLSSDHKATSVAGENLVVKEDELQNAFAWKKLSIVAFSDATIIINKGLKNECTIKLMNSLAYDLATGEMPIYSLEFVDSGIQYYYNAGY